MHNNGINIWFTLIHYWMPTEWGWVESTHQKKKTQKEVTLARVVCVLFVCVCRCRSGSDVSVCFERSSSHTPNTLSYTVLYEAAGKMRFAWATGKQYTCTHLMIISRTERNIICYSVCVCVCVERAQTRPKNERRRWQNKKNAQHIVRTLGFLVHKRVKRTEYSQ